MYINFCFIHNIVITSLTVRVLSFPTKYTLSENPTYQQWKYFYYHSFEILFQCRIYWEPTIFGHQVSKTIIFIIIIIILFTRQYSISSIRVSKFPFAISQLLLSNNLIFSSTWFWPPTDISKALLTH